MEDITEILNGEHCATKEQGFHSLDPTTGAVEEQSREIRNTLDMVERVPTDGCSSFSETSIEGCTPLYVGDIDISVEENVPRSTSTSPPEFHEVDPREREEEEVHLPELHFLAGSLKMSECKIKEVLHTLHGTHTLMPNICWKLEEKTSMEDMEKFQKAMTSIKGNFIHLLSNRDSLLELVEFLHGACLKDE